MVKEMGEIQWLIASTGWKKIEALILDQRNKVIESLVVCLPEDLIAKQVEIKTLNWILQKVKEMLAKEVVI